MTPSFPEEKAAASAAAKHEKEEIGWQIGFQRLHTHPLFTGNQQEVVSEASA